MSRRMSAVAGAIALALSGAAGAADLGDMFSVRGYSTLGAAYTDLETADFSPNPFMNHKGIGYSDDWSTEPDSRLGLQIDAKLTQRLSAVVQLVSEAEFNSSWDGDPNNSYNPSLEWANLSYKVTDKLTVRGGRIVLPVLMAGEYRKVGFANHWLRAPVEMYGQVSFTTSDGGDVSYRSKLAGGVNTVHAHYGVNSLRTSMFKAQAEVWGFNNTIEFDALKLRAAYMHLSFETVEGFAASVQPFIAGANSMPFGLGQSAAREATRLLAVYDPALTEQKVEYFNLGAAYDKGSWFAMSEAMYVDSPGLLPSSLNGYVSGGVRLGQFTPFMTYARTHTDVKSEPGIPTAGLAMAPQLVAGAQAINESLVRGWINKKSSQQTISLGMRWDVARSFALKAQYDYVDVRDGSRGLLLNQQPNFRSGENFSVVGLAVDFVF